MARNGYGMASRVTKCGRNHGLVGYGTILKEYEYNKCLVWG